MQQYNVEFFDRTLTYKHRDIVYGINIDDDYLAAVTNTMDISATDLVINGDFIRITSDDVDFFGVVSDVSPGEYITTVSYRPFITIFDEPFAFNITRQGTDSSISHSTLEGTIKAYIDWFYTAGMSSTDPDELQKLPLEVNIVPSENNRVKNWTFYYEAQVEGTNYCITNLYSDIIVPALKLYGVFVRVVPALSEKLIRLYIDRNSSDFKIDADLDNVNVKTMKYNERPNGINKLVVYNSADFSNPITFYVYTDRTWGIGVESGKERITPVVRDVQIVTPDSSYEDPLDGFAVAALDAAYSTLSGLQWDNLIELETAVNDPLVKPYELSVGQLVSIWYKGGKYTSMLTGKTYSNNTVTLLFGSERIQYSKRAKKGGVK